MFEDIELTITPTVAAVSALLTLLCIALLALALLFRRLGSRRNASQTSP